MEKEFRWNNEKDAWLRETRGIGFEDVLSGEVIDIIENESPMYKNQRVFIIRLYEYIYVVPFVEEEKYIFLKTMHKSRKYNKRYHS